MGGGVRWSLVPAIFWPMVPGPSHFLPFGPWSLKCLSIGPRFTAFCPIDLHTPTTTPHKYPFLICHYVFRLKILLQFKLYRFIKMTPPCKTIQNPSSKIQSQKLKLFYLLISIQTRMNIQQGRHESQGKTCRVINECCERLKNNYSKNVRQ